MKTPRSSARLSENDALLADPAVFAIGEAPKRLRELGTDVEAGYVVYAEVDAKTAVATEAARW